jgi:Putative peptidoglycan binding domain
MATPTPRMPDMPPEREQMLVQEMNRAERPAGYRSVDMMAGMDIYDTNGMREAPNVGEQYDQAMPVKPNAKPRPRGRRRAAIDNRATEMMLDGSMAGEGMKAATEAGDGFRVSNRVGRAVGYGAVGTAAIGYAAVVKAAEQEAKGWEEALDESVEERAPLETFDLQKDAEPQSVWNRFSLNDRIRFQNTLNTVVDQQISTDGGWGAQTESAIREFQESAGLPVTGVADNQTIKALNLMAAKNAWQWEQQEKRRRVGRSASTTLQ